MPNLPSSIRRVRLTQKETAYNRAQRSMYRNAVKKFERILAEGNMEEAEAALLRAISRLDRAAAKGIIHKNKAARTKSRLMKKFAAAKASQAS